MRPAACALLLAALVLLLVAASAPADAASPVAGGRLFRFRAQQKQREQFSNWGVLMKTFVDDKGNPTDAATWAKSDAMAVLQALFKAPIVKAEEVPKPADYKRPYSTVAQMAEIANKVGQGHKLDTSGENCADDSSVAGCRVLVFINHLRAFAENNPDVLKKTEGVVERSLYIQGGGPSGLATALYARARQVDTLDKNSPNLKLVPGEPLGTVKVKEIRSLYVRQHMVTLKDTQTIGQLYDGGRVLLEAVGGKPLRMWFEFGGEDGEKSTGGNPKIITARLEGILALAALVVGVDIEYVPPKVREGPDSSDFLEESAGNDAKWTDFDVTQEQGIIRFGLDTGPCVAPQEPHGTASTPDREKFGVFVAADGAGSSLRSDPFFYGKENEKIYFDADVSLSAKNVGADPPTATKNEKVINVGASAKKHPHSVLAFVLNGGGSCDEALKWWDTDTDAGDRREPFQIEKVYVKKATSVCMLEVHLRPKGGKVYLRSLREQCGWNFNIFRKKLSSTVKSERKSMQMAFAVYRSITNAALAPNKNAVTFANALGTFKTELREIKVYSVGMRVAFTAASKVNQEVFVGRYDAEKKKVFLLAGDAAREAVPDDGMGANNGMYMGHRAAIIARTWTAPPEPSPPQPSTGGVSNVDSKATTTTEKKDPNVVTEQIADLAKHATAVAVGLRIAHKGWFTDGAVGDAAAGTFIVPGIKIADPNSDGRFFFFEDAETSPKKVSSFIENFKKPEDKETNPKDNSQKTSNQGTNQGKSNASKTNANPSVKNNTGGKKKKNNLDT